MSDLLCWRVRHGGQSESSAPRAVPALLGVRAVEEVIYLRQETQMQRIGVQQTLTSENSLESFTKDGCTMVAEAEMCGG